jgi:hypothetical protein
LGVCRPIAPISAPHLTHYCIVRRDISPGLQAANLIHAAGESSPGNLPKGTFAVAITIADERELRLLADRLEAAGIALTRIVESDGAHAGQLMAIGLTPCDRDKVRRYLSSYPLLRGHVCRVCEEAA